jgi:hypothetical protein
MVLTGCLHDLMLSVLAIEPKVHGFEPGQDAIFFREIKIHITPSFRVKVKPEAPCCKILRHVNITCKYKQKYFSKPNSHYFCLFLLLATRLLCWYSAGGQISSFLLSI